MLSTGLGHLYAVLLTLATKRHYHCGPWYFPSLSLWVHTHTLNLSPHACPKGHLLLPVENYVAVYTLHTHPSSAGWGRAVKVYCLLLQWTNHRQSTSCSIRPTLYWQWVTSCSADLTYLCNWKTQSASSEARREVSHILHKENMPHPLLVMHTLHVIMHLLQLPEL